ncbi:MAG TPA: SIS domain-containing protein, partial [Pyrinomonadaceae bacterium]|nr:SIS domain-containing protein [Pyrinomonadaceae bacterium]
MNSHRPNPDNSRADVLARSLEEHLKTIQALIDSRLAEIEAAGSLIWDALKSGNKILLCGNGGSA